MWILLAWSLVSHSEMKLKSDYFLSIEKGRDQSPIKYEIKCSQGVAQDKNTYCKVIKSSKLGVIAEAPYPLIATQHLINTFFSQLSDSEAVFVDDLKNIQERVSWKVESPTKKVQGSVGSEHSLTSPELNPQRVKIRPVLFSILEILETYLLTKP